MTEVSEILKFDKWLYLAITGGGTEAISELLRHGGASSVLLHAEVPYSSEALTKFLGRIPEKYCSKATACQMASQSFYNGTQLARGFKKWKDTVGVGVTCSLARKDSDETRPDGSKRKNVAHICVHDKSRAIYSELEFTGTTCRETQEAIVGHYVIQMIDWFLKGEPFYGPTQNGIYRILNEEIKAGDIHPDLPKMMEMITTFSNGEYVYGPSSTSGLQKPSCMMLSGSFNPCHRQHCHMAEVAFQEQEIPVTFEICMQNPDKGMLDFFTLNDRIKSLPHNQLFYNGFVITNTPRFTAKAKLFPNTTFLVGMDTYNRIFDDHYYTENEFRWLSHTLDQCGAQFLVFPRPGFEKKGYYPTRQIKDDFIADVSKLYTASDWSSTKERNNAKV